MTPAPDVSEGRRTEILNAAVQVFLRYGYRKTSMDEVAHAAGLSRPGLYLYFSAKELLFREAVTHLVHQCLLGAHQALADNTQPLTARLVNAFSAMHGQYVGDGVSAQHMEELIQTGTQLAGDTIEAHNRLFREALIQALEEGVMADATLAPGASVADVAEMLEAISAGLKHRVGSLPEYLERMRTATRVLVPVACDR